MRSKLIRILLIPILCCMLLPTPRARAAGDWTHILLVGTDGREDLSGARSDAVLLCSLSPQGDSLLLTSFLRDLYLPIPGWGGNRLNAAYAYGGRELLRKTLEGYFGIAIQGCVEVDFTQFSTIIDTLGGVELTLRQDEADRLGLSPGTQILTGEKALAYSRIRDLDPDGDFSRTRRQRAVLTSLLSTWRGAGFRKILETVQRLIPLLSTDMDPARVLHLVFTLAPELQDLRVSTLQLPTPETCSSGMVRGMDVLLPREGELAKLLHRTLENCL